MLAQLVVEPLAELAVVLARASAALQPSSLPQQLLELSAALLVSFALLASS